MIPVTTYGTVHRPRGALVLALSAALAAAACEPAAPELALPLDADTYVTVMAELTDVRRFPPPGPDEATRTARADSARQQVLDRHGVTADDLLAFAELVGPDPDRMLELTERVVSVSDSLAREHGEFGRGAGLSGAGFPGDSATDASFGGDSATADSARGRLPDRLPIDPERLERYRRSLRDGTPAP